MADANIKAVITADDRASKTLQGFGNTVNNTAKKIKIAVAAAGVATVAFGVSSVKAAMESEDAIAQLNAVLRSTKGAAGVTTKAATDLATSLQQVTKFSDEEVISAENMLLTFTKIGKDIFPQATETVLDMSQALGQDLKSSSIQLGKALQDPILGVTALRRVGVNFSEDQQKVIKNLVDTGQSAKAQAMILKELQTEFGGSARAAGDTFGGALARLKNNINDIQESIGFVIVEALDPFIGKIAQFVAHTDWQAVIKNTTAAIDNFGKKVIDLGTKIFDVLQPSLTALWNTLNQQVVPVLTRLWKEVIVPLIPVIGTLLVVAITTLVDAFNALLRVITPVINWMLDHKGDVIAFAAAFGVLKAALAFNKAVLAFSAAMSAIEARMAVTKGKLASFAAFVRSPTMTGSFGILAAVGVGAFVEIQNAATKAKNAIIAAGDAATMAGIAQQEALKTIGDQFRAGKINKSTRDKLIGQIMGHAGGGSVIGGTPYMVGEQGPELFVPNQSGNIVPNNRMPSGGTTVINISPSIGIFAGTPSERRKLALTLLEDLRDLATQKNTTVSMLLGANRTVPMS